MHTPAHPNGITPRDARILELTCENSRLKSELSNMTAYKDQINRERMELTDAINRIPRAIKWLLGLMRIGR
jgi:hypothetical protein